MSLDPITALIDGATTIVNKIFPDASEAQKLKIQADLAQLAAETDLAKGQQAVNQVEAANGNLFVSGARPFIMWICGVGLAYHTILQPLLVFIMFAYGNKIELPVFNTELLNVTLMGMLGLGTMRTVEKIKNVASK